MHRIRKKIILWPDVYLFKQLFICTDKIENRLHQRTFAIAGVLVKDHTTFRCAVLQKDAFLGDFVRMDVYGIEVRYVT